MVWSILEIELLITHCRVALSSRHTKKTTGGFPTRAIAVLSFLLFPPLEENTINCHVHNVDQQCLLLCLYLKGVVYLYGASCTVLINLVPVPVCATALVSMLVKVQPLDFYVHHLLDGPLWDATKTGKHCEEFTTCQPLQQNIKLNYIIRGWRDDYGEASTTMNV